MQQTKLNKIMHDIESAEFATAAGTDMHAQMAKVRFQNGDFVGPADIVSKIKTHTELSEIMGPLSRIEVPLAGYVDGVFLSRRVDRLYVNKDTKTVVVLDYKTDANKKKYYEKYLVQLMEYYKLLKEIFPDFNIKCKILWLNDFTLENVI